MNKTKKLSAGLLASAMVSIALTGPSFAANVDAHSQIHKADGVTYACTGIAGERANPRWNVYPAKIEVDEHDGAYLGNEKLTVDDAAGKTVLSTTCTGPWLVAKLAPGRYTVEAKVGTYQQGARLDVPAKGQAALILSFPDRVG